MNRIRWDIPEGVDEADQRQLQDYSQLTLKGHGNQRRFLMTAYRSRVSSTKSKMRIQGTADRAALAPFPERL